VALDPNSSDFVVAWNNRFLKECQLMVFNPKNNNPLQAHKVKHVVESLTYLPRRSDDLESLLSDRKSNILYITDKNDMHILGEPLPIKPKISTQKLESKSHSYFSDILGNSNKISDKLSSQESDMYESDTEEKPKESPAKRKEEEKLIGVLENSSQASNNFAPVLNSNQVEQKK